MIGILSDTDGEDLIRETQFDIAVPVHVEMLFGETKIFAYPSVVPLCETYAKTYADNLFSPEAVNFLQKGCAEFCASLGYSADRHSATVGENYLQKNAPKVDFSFCERIRREGKYENKTTFDLAACLAAERVIFAVVDNGAIVSLAVTCEAPMPENEGGMIEISAETAPAFRGKGYATAAVSALSAYLVSRGFAPLYKCRNENRISASVARGAGFEKCGDFAYFVYRKNR